MDTPATSLDTNPSNFAPSAPQAPTPIPAPNDVVTPPSQSNTPPKKFPAKRVFIGLSVFLLVVGTVSTIFLVQRNQDIRRDASSGSTCNQAPDCELLNSPGNSGSYTAPKTIAYIDITNQTEFRFNPGNTNDGCYNVSIQGTQLTWSKVGSGSSCKDISNIQVWVTTTSTNTPTPSPTVTPTPPPGTGTVTPTGPTKTPTVTPTLPPGVTAACGAVEAYDLNWNKLTSSQLSQLKSGEKVRFAVGGTASSGTFDKAKITVNGTALAETTTKKPGSDQFYSEYTIPGGATNFSVSGQIHHSTLGWI